MLGEQGYTFKSSLLIISFRWMLSIQIFLWPYNEKSYFR
jgi:hypothetical protein